MDIITSARAFYTRLKKDERGSFAMSWGVSLLAIVFAVGSAFDASQAGKAKQLAQAAADNMALTASIAVDRDNDERFTEGVPYTYAEIGGPSEDFTGTMTGKVEYDIEDGDERLIARATISGSYQTAFMAMIGVDAISLNAVSDVAYAAEEGSPTSVFFVADNSGSMSNKMTSLETSLKDFMTTLDTLDNDGNDDTFRTALYPYSADPDGYYSDINSDGVIPFKVVDPEWGTLSDYDITQMTSRAGTDSSGSLQRAADAFDLEAAQHIAVNGEPDPLKFMVFMTDGANNKTTECTTQEVWVENKTAEYWWKYKNNGSIKYKYQEPWNWWKWTHVPSTSDGTGYYEDQEVCTYDYHFDVRSLEACDQMKDSGVLVYAIAYAVADSQKEHAEDFMLKCSSGDNFFKSADDSSALEAAFAEIGDSVLTEVIRIKR